MCQVHAGIALMPTHIATVTQGADLKVIMYPTLTVSSVTLAHGLARLQLEYSAHFRPPGSRRILRIWEGYTEGLARLS